MILPTSNPEQFLSQGINARAMFCGQTKMNDTALLASSGRFLRQIAFIVKYQSHDVFRKLPGCIVIGIKVSLAGVNELKDDIGPLNFTPASFNTQFLDGIPGFTQACCIDDMQGNALDLDHLPHGIARGSGNIRHNGPVFSRETVQQG